jgi:hypothetical protein
MGGRKELPNFKPLTATKMAEVASLAALVF